MMRFMSPPCAVCSKTTEIQLNREDLDRWRSGAYIQDVWPGQTADWRELLITGTHPECWDSLFPPEGEDEEN